MSLWTMKETIRMTGTTENALRYYSARDVISPTVQEDSGRKKWLYDDVAIEKLKKLYVLRFLGVPLDDIRDALKNEEHFRRITFKSLARLRKERWHMDLKIYVAQTMAVAYGSELIPADEKIGEFRADILDEVIRGCVLENTKERR